MLPRSSRVLLLILDGRPPRPTPGGRPADPPLVGAPPRVVGHRDRARDDPLYHPFESIFNPPPAAIIVVVVAVVVVDFVFPCVISVPSPLFVHPLMPLPPTTTFATMALSVAQVAYLVVLAVVAGTMDDGDDLV